MAIKTLPMKNERIFERRKALGLTQLDVAKVTGVSKQSVSKWEKGDSFPKGESLVLLAKILKCDANWILTGRGAPDIKEEGLSVEAVDLEPQGAFPLISWVQAGAWSEIFLTDLNEADHYPCPVKCSSQTFILKVMGKSMNPVFNEGELIFVDPEIEAINGKYVIARLDDENQATFKQLIVEDGHKFLQAANPNWPTPITPINGNCTIVGVVISSMRLF